MYIIHLCIHTVSICIEIYIHMHEAKDAAGICIYFIQSSVCAECVEPLHDKPRCLFIPLVHSYSRNPSNAHAAKPKNPNKPGAASPQVRFFVLDPSRYLRV